MSGVNSQLNTFPTASSNGHSMGDYTPAFTIRFWGVRGSIPTSGPGTAFYGGNTPCVELLVGNQRLILDGGTGLRVLGESIQEEPSIETHLFFTHTQLDRIQGFPFFRPAFCQGNKIHVYGPESTNGASIKHALSEHMVRPRFHVPLYQMEATLSFKTLLAGSVVEIEDVTVEAIMLNSDNSALGYKITWQDYTVVYATDSSSTNQQPDLQSLGSKVDLLIFDAVQPGSHYYSPQALNETRQLETWKQSLDSTLGLDAKQVVLFYLAPDHEDTFLRHIENEVQVSYPNVQIAQEGAVLTVGHCSKL